MLVETPTRRIIVDTGLGNDKQGRNVPTWNNRKDPFLDKLTAAGFPPDSIDTVLCTHLHVDHVGWNTKLVDGKWVPTFTNARYVFGKTEYEYWRDHSDTPDRAAVFSDSVKPIADAGKAELIASDAQACGRDHPDPHTRPQPGPYERPHQVGRRGGPADGGRGPPSLPDGPSRLVVDRGFRSRQSAESRRDLFSRFADTPTLVIGGHFGAGHIKRDGDAFRFVALESGRVKCCPP